MSMITVQTTINAPISKVRDMRTKSEHITGWNFASDDRHCPKAQNDIRVGGRFVWAMAAKDGSFSFDFSGTYTAVEEHRYIAYTMDGEDARKAEITFEQKDDNTVVLTESFDPENQNPLDMQRAGWQSILDNFKKYVEKNTWK